MALKSDYQISYCMIDRAKELLSFESLYLNMNFTHLFRVVQDNITLKGLDWLKLP